MAPDPEVVSILKAYCETPDGMVAVGRGESLPSDALDSEADRLRALGALGAPVDPSAAEPGDEVTALTASLTEAQITDYVRDTTIKDIVAAVGDDADLAKRVLTAEADATNGESRPSLVKALEKVISAAEPGDEV